MMDRRRGFALLLVLAATLVVSAGAIVAIGLLLDTRRQVVSTVSDDHLHDALAAGQRLSCAWITANAAQVILPPEGGPIPLLNEYWHTQEGDGSLVVQLYDACAMIPAQCLGPSGSLRSALPTGWAGVAMPDLPATTTAANEPLDWLERINLTPELFRFPLEVAPTKTVTWSTMGSILDGAPRTAPPAHTGLAVIASPHTQGAINLNTAPESLLRSAFTQAGLGGLDDVLRRRQRGLFITNSPQTPVAAVRFRFVTTSHCWHAHISAAWNAARRSWWVVVAGNPTEPRIVQRHDADR